MVMLIVYAGCIVTGLADKMIDEKKDGKCSLHKWEYDHEGRMMCVVCQYRI